LIFNLNTRLSSKIAESVLIGVIAIILLPIITQAQPSRYWSNSFGEEAALLSGSVVGADAGLSSIFYNPAFIAKMRSSRFTLNADIVNFDSYTWENALGTGENVKSVRPSLAPGFTAILIKPKKKDRLTYEVSILTRDQYEFDISVNRKKILDVFDKIPGNEIYTGTFESNSRFNDVWFGFGGAYELSERISFGVSSFISVKSLSESLLLEFNAFPQEQVIIDSVEVPFFNSNYTRRSNTKGTNVRWINKIGILYNIENWGFGANFTLPSLNLVGNGEVNKKVSASNIPEQTGENTRDYILIDAQKDISVQWKDPLSISVGMHYATPNSKSEFSTTLEYFFPIDLYKSFSAEINPNITNKEDFEQLTNKDFLSQYMGATEVLNVAVGYKRVLSPSVNLLLGFRSDQDALKGVDFSNVHPFNRPVNALNMNVYHFTGGTQLNLSKGHIVAGIQWSSGSDLNKPQIGNLNPEVPNNDPPLNGPIKNEMDVFYKAFSIIFGFDFNLSGD